MRSVEGGLPQARHSIFGEFMLLITVMILPLLFVMGWYALHSFSQVTERASLHALENLADEKVTAINVYVENHLKRAESLSIMPSTQTAMGYFSQAFHDGGIDSTRYQQIDLEFGKVFEHYYSLWDYYDLFLIDPQGNIVYSITHERDFATNVQTGPYKASGLAYVFRESITMLQTNSSTVAYYEPSQEAAGFVATPIMKDGAILGVLAMQFDTDKLDQTINNLAGLGETGEVVAGQLVGDQVLITIPLRHDPDAAFKRTINVQDENALAMRMAAQGESGSATLMDWRDQEVLAVWQYIPSLQWGVVVKIDTDEAFGYWKSVQGDLLGYAGLGLLVIYLLLFLFARRITQPILKLTQASLDVGSGEKNIQIDALSAMHNEVGVLSRVFSKMVIQLQESKAELEGMVEDLAENNRTLDRRVAEQIEYMQAIVKYSADGIITMNSEGNIDSVNPALCQMFEYNQQELIAQPMTMLMPERYVEAHVHGFNQCRGEGHERVVNRSVELEGLRKSGEEITIDLKVDEMHVGSQVFFLGRIRDITDEKIKREKLEHTQRLESLGVLAGGIAHDFNNLLTAILGNAAMARRRTDDQSPINPMLDNIEKSSERAAALCKQMLAYSGKGKFVVEHINLTTMIEEMMNLLQVSIQKNVIMRLDLSEQLLGIEADVAQMQQVIMNLVINASEAIDKKSGIITIYTGVVSIDRDYIQSTYMDDGLTPGHFVVLEVSDTGCGMDKDTVKRIFDPFFTTKFTGRGLGMSAIIGIVRGHKGAIKVYSEPGKGTTFKILLPCSDRFAVGGDEVSQEPDKEGGYGTVLIVDDEETVREVASMMLEDAGFTVITAVDGQEGVDMFREHQSDIAAVLLDMTMPRMNGEEVFREIRMIQPDVKVILSSGYNEQDATSRFTGKGLAGFLQKPYSPEALQTIVLDAVNGK